MRVWGWPLAIACLTLSGLLTGLVSDAGIGDLWAWLGLSVPVAVSLVCCWR